MARNGAHIGCLGLLTLWALLGGALQYFGEWGRHGSPNEGEGGRFAIVGLLGVVLYLLIFGTFALIRWVISLTRRERRGFPVITRKDDEE